MANRRPTSRAARLAAVGLLWVLCSLAPLAQSATYKPKNGLLNWKAVLLGGAFRVSTAVPLHGDFSKYARLEVVRAESLIGSDVPAGLLDKLAEGLAGEFRKGRHFADVEVVNGVTISPPASHRVDSFRDPDPIDAPMRTWDDLVAFDAERRAAGAREAVDTLIVRCQVIDYAKGNKLLQLLMIDLGDAILTLRISYYDKASGEELGRSIVSSNNASKGLPSAFSPRTELTGAIEGLVDQVTRRKLAGER